jgi:predicted HAD superfamily hydrolase
MNVLFFMQPWIEKNKPAYRSQSFLKDQRTIMDCLLTYAPDVQIHCIIGDALSIFNSDVIAQLSSSIVVHVIPQNELKEIFQDYKAEVAGFYRSSSDTADETYGQFRQLIVTRLGDFAPDLVFSFENYDDHLRSAFPEAVVINQYFSPFSREPFPRLTCFDCNGIFKSALTTKCFDELCNLENTPVATEFMDHIRAEFFGELLLSYDYTSIALKPYQKAFDFLISLPMQGSNYFAFEGNSHFTNLFDYICHVLDRIDPRVGVVVTEHSAHEPVLTEDLCQYLRQTYPNFIYVEAFNTYSFHSQQVLCHTDAVLTVSSSLSFMAAMQRKPAFCIGSFESFVSHGNEIEKIYELLTSAPVSNFDGAFHFLFKHFYVPVNQQKAKGELFSYLNTIVENTRKGKKQLEVYSSATTGLTKAEDVIALARKDKFISKLPAGVQQDLLRGTGKPKQGKDIHPKTLLTLIRSDKYQVISFDMFDTLVVRPFMRPRHLFSVIEEEARIILGMAKLPFARIREKTEKRLRKQKWSATGNWEEVPLSEIYETLKTELSWTDAETQAIMEFERQTELRLCAPLRSNQDVFHTALAANKRVVVTTDIYLDEKLIHQILTNCGFDGFERLFVSSSYGQRKQDGRLYKKLLNDLSVDREQVLHIGDNTGSDGAVARSCGIDSCVISKPVDRVIREHSRLERLSTRYAFHIGHSQIFGTLSNMLGEKLQIKSIAKNSHGNFSPYYLGAVLFGPLLYGFSTWLHDQVTGSEIARLHFLSREGALLKAAYDAACDVRGGGPQSNYLLASRRSALAATMTSRADINALVYKKQTPCPLHHILGYKLGLSQDEYDDALVQSHGFTQVNEMVDLQKDRSRLLSVIDALEIPILESAAQERQGYVAYLQRQRIALGSQRDAIIDIGYAGTIQACLQKLTGVEFSGFYIGVKRGEVRQPDMCMTGYLFDELKAMNQSTATSFDQNVLLYEALLCAPTQSFYRIQLDGDRVVPRFNSGAISARHNSLIEELHKGALDYMRYALAHIPEGLHLDREILIGAAQDFFKDPCAKEAALFESISFDNRMGGAFDTRLAPSRPEDITRDRSFLWREGTCAVLSAFEEAAQPINAKALLSYV